MEHRRSHSHMRGHAGRHGGSTEGKRVAPLLSDASVTLFYCLATLWAVIAAGKVALAAPLFTAITALAGAFPAIAAGALLAVQLPSIVLTALRNPFLLLLGYVACLSVFAAASSTAQEEVVAATRLLFTAILSLLRLGQEEGKDITRRLRGVTQGPQATLAQLQALDLPSTIARGAAAAMLKGVSVCRAVTDLAAPGAPQGLTVELVSRPCGPTAQPSGEVSAEGHSVHMSNSAAHCSDPSASVHASNAFATALATANQARQPAPSAHAPGRKSVVNPFTAGLKRAETVWDEDTAGGWGGPHVWKSRLERTEGRGETQAEWKLRQLRAELAKGFRIDGRPMGKYRIAVQGAVPYVSDVPERDF
jgi:hypothetical protein